MIPLFLITEISEIKNVPSEAKSSNFNQDNHYWLFNHYLNIHFHILTHPPLFQLHLHFCPTHHHKCLHFGFRRSHSHRGKHIVYTLVTQTVGRTTAARYQLNKLIGNQLPQHPLDLKETILDYPAIILTRGGYDKTRDQWFFLFLLSHNLLISNDTTDRRLSEVIVVVRVISFLNRISHNELRSCWNFEIIYKDYSRIAQRVEIVWAPIFLKVLMWSSDPIWCSTL